MKRTTTFTKCSGVYTCKSGRSACYECNPQSGMYTVLCRDAKGGVIDKVCCDDRQMAMEYYRAFQRVAAHKSDSLIVKNWWRLSATTGISISLPIPLNRLGRNFAFRKKHPSFTLVKPMIHRLLRTMTFALTAHFSPRRNHEYRVTNLWNGVRWRTV